MLRSALLSSKLGLSTRAGSSIATASRVSTWWSTNSALTQARATTTPVTMLRFYSHAPELTPELVKERLLEILEGYDKVNQGVEITDATDFSKDLGLDSLDIVEVVMAIEEEFSIGIPDDQADKIRTFGDAQKLIENNEHAV